MDMADPSKSLPALRRRDIGIAMAAFVAATGCGIAGAMAESRRPSQPVTVKRPPARLVHAAK
jgi:hypothetical protein